MKKALIVVGAAMVLIPFWAQAGGASKVTAAKAIASAAARIKIAEGMNDQWLATLAAFKASKAAQAKGDFTLAQSKAATAEKLANLSIQQATMQKKVWVNEVVK
jgi:hypothetical protein